MKAAHIGKKVLVGALRLMAMGAITTGMEQLKETNKSMSREFNREMKEGFKYYGEPKLQKLKIIKK